MTRRKLAALTIPSLRGWMEPTPGHCADLRARFAPGGCCAATDEDVVEVAREIRRRRDPYGLETDDDYRAARAAIGYPETRAEALDTTEDA